MCEFRVIIKGCKPDHECEDCDYFRGHLSWWCTNKEAQSLLGTSKYFPKNGCKFWKSPMIYEDLPWYKRAFMSTDYLVFENKSDNSRKPSKSSKSKIISIGIPIILFIIFWIIGIMIYYSTHLGRIIM